MGYNKIMEKQITGVGPHPKPWPTDLKYDKENDCLIANRDGSKDPTLKRSRERFDEYVRNIYRVLMSRGMKGCYVYFVDKEVEKFFRSRMRLN